MDNVFKYYQFSTFFKDNSGAFSGNEISYTSLNDTHFLIFEKKNTSYVLYVSKYLQRSDIGIEKPLILELLVEDYDKSLPEHRLMIKQYLY